MAHLREKHEDHRHTFQHITFPSLSTFSELEVSLTTNVCEVCYSLPAVTCIPNIGNYFWVPSAHLSSTRRSHICQLLMRYLLLMSFFFCVHASVLPGVNRWGQRWIFSYMSPASCCWHIINLHRAIAELSSVLYFHCLRLWQHYDTEHVPRKMQTSLLLVGSRRASR